MNNLHQSEKTSLKNENIFHKRKFDPKNSSFDEEFLENIKDLSNEDIIPSKHNKINNNDKNFNIKNKTNKEKIQNKKDNKTKEPDKYCLFLYEDEEKNKKIYSFHRNHWNIYDLRCKDRNCLGTAQYNVESWEIKVTKKCSISNFIEHNYIKEKSFIERIKANQVEKEEMKKSENQKYFFKYSYQENPNLTYLDIIYKINGN